MISGPHPQNALTPAQMQAQQQAQMQATDRARLRSRKPTDKNIPEGVEECIIGDGVQQYKDLKDLERRFDATMMRKRLDIIDAVNRDAKVSFGKSTYRASAYSSIAIQDPSSLDQQYC
jgi:SWI/SNF-related matrix-associated actin-dependent regulator of chromatin subfamily D